MIDISNSEVIDTILKMNKTDINLFKMYIMGSMNNEQRKSKREDFQSHEPFVNHLQDETKLSQLQQDVIYYFLDYNDIQKKCVEKNLDYNENTKKCCPINTVYNPETKRCKNTKFDYNKKTKRLKKTTKEDCKDLDFNEHTKKCCNKGQKYNKVSKRCKKDTLKTKPS